MSLGRLSLISTAICLAGMIALLAVSVRSVQMTLEHEQIINELLELDHSLEEFVSASHILLIFGADPGLWGTYHAESQLLHSRLEEMGEDYPDARKAAYRMQMIVGSVESALNLHGSGTSTNTSTSTSKTDSIDGIGPLGMSTPTSMVLHQITSQSIALNTALDDALTERKLAIMRDARWTAVILIGAALAFGLLCLVAFLTLYRKVVKPTRATISVLEQVRLGQSEARAPVSGNKELAKLAATLNSLLDEREAADQKVQQRQQNLEATLRELRQTRDRLERAQKIGKIGTWELDHEKQTLLWSDQALDIFGQSRETFGATLDSFVDIIHCDDRDWVLDKRNEWLKDGGQFKALYRIVQPSGETRWIDVRAQFDSDVDGQPKVSTGTLIDVTEMQHAKSLLVEQTRMIEIASKTARLGGWSIDLASGENQWSEITAQIHGVDRNYTPTIETGIDFYAPEYQDRIQKVFTACAERGEAYDEELQIIDAGGQRRWVRVLGQPVRDEAGTIIKVQGAIQDITERKQLELKNADLTAELATMLESITDGFVAFDSEWRYVYINKEGARILGLCAENAIGTTLWSQFPELKGTKSESLLRRTKEQGIPTSVEEYFEPLGIWFDTHFYPWQGGVASFFRDVSETRKMMEQLREQQDALLDSRNRLDSALKTRQALINSLPAHIALMDVDSNIIDVNQQWQQFGTDQNNPDPSFGVGLNYLEVCESATGECSESAKQIAAGLRKLLAGKRGQFTMEYPCHAPDQQRWFRVTFNPLASVESMPGGAVAMHVDVTERKRAEQQLEQVAYIDPLTGLLTRNGFLRELRAHLNKTGWQPNGIVAMIDVVAQRDINDVHGFETGDQLLVELGQRLRQCAGGSGLAGRGGGDEFVVYLPPVAKETAVDSKFTRLQELLTTINRPFKLGAITLNIKVWIGFNFLGDKQRPLDKPLREAELALFEHQEAKMATEWIEYTQQLAKQTRERRRLTEELKLALENEEFELHFQPKVDLTNGRLIAAEALLRWNHPVRGLQPPGLFIPVAEQSQLIGPIGDWALRDACRQLSVWRAAGMDIVRVSVNVSVVQFMMRDFPARVRDALSTFNVAPSDLSLEITESVFERQSGQLLRDMRELHDMGVRLSLDDFGTGYSSLLYLKQYPFDEIKIDRAFVSGLLDDDFSQNIVRTVLDVAAALGAEVVAEGIEEPEITAALLEMGCRIGQGFYYSVPLATEDFSWLLEKHSTLPLTERQSSN